MMMQKGPSGCDARPLKAVSKINSAFHSATALQSQINFLNRLAAIDPALLAVVAVLALSTIGGRP